MNGNHHEQDTGAGKEERAIGGTDAPAHLRGERHPTSRFSRGIKCELRPEREVTRRSRDQTEDERSGLPTIDDPLPGQPDNAFQAVKRLLKSCEGEQQ